jgi:hypothetical protein
MVLFIKFLFFKSFCNVEILWAPYFTGVPLKIRSVIWSVKSRSTIVGEGGKKR